MGDFAQAQALLRRFRGDTYLHGLGVLPRVGPMVARAGATAVLVRDLFPGAAPFVDQIEAALAAAGVDLLAEIDGARANAPREDVERITAALSAFAPQAVVSFGGGSTIDAVKASGVLRTLGGTVDAYFGTGLVSARLAAAGTVLAPHVAIQTAAGSGAHLTKYANITDLRIGQKKLIVDQAIVPIAPVFDYAVTIGAPRSLTADGALDGVAHALEVLFGAVGKPYYGLMEQVARETLSLVLEHLPYVLAHPTDAKAREALGMATDLGAFAITLGGTNGPHLNSFSLVDVLSHGRACAILNPYYAVLFAPAIQVPLRLVAAVLKSEGYAPPRIETLAGRELAIAVAKAFVAFQEQIGFPTRLDDVPQFGDEHVRRALAAAKDPQLKSKLENMPVPLAAEMIDDTMGLLLQAARTGDLDAVPSLPWKGDQ